MRNLLLGIIAALLCLPATAGATLATPVEIPAATGEIPQAMAFSDDRSGVVVTQVPAGADGGPTQALVKFPAGTRETFADTTLLDSAQRKDGGVDLLVRRGSELTLRRVKPNGKAYDLFSVKTTSGRAAIARGATRTVVAWREGTTLRLVTRPDNGIPSKPRIARLRLPSVADLALAVDVSNRLVAAVSTKQSGLVLASLTARGTVLQRQVFPKTSGLVSAAVTSHGRVGVLIEDTGIVGDGGACVSDNGGRHIRVAMRERKAKRFRDVQTIESPPFGCGSSGALLRAGPKDIFALLYQAGSVDLPPLRRAGRHRHERPPLHRRADAGREGTRRHGRRVLQAARSSRRCCARRPTPGSSPGALSLLRTGLPEEPVSTGPAFAPLLGLDQGARPCSPGARAPRCSSPATSRSAGADRGSVFWHAYRRAAPRRARREAGGAARCGACSAGGLRDDADVGLGLVPAVGVDLLGLVV